MIIPKYKIFPGIKFGTESYPAKLDLFFDLQCPYSKKSWDIIGGSILNEWKGRLSVYFHPICLSHHRQSWDLTRTLFAINSIDDSKTTDFINLVYAQQERFYNAAWKPKTEDELLTELATLARKIIDLPTSDLLEKIESDEVYYDAKKSIHYSAIKQVWSTPTFVLNDVPVSELTSSTSLEDWNDFMSNF